MHGYASRKGTCRVGPNRQKIDMSVACALRGTYQFSVGLDREQRPLRCEAGEEQNSCLSAAAAALRSGTNAPVELHLTLAQVRKRVVYAHSVRRNRAGRIRRRKRGLLPPRALPARLAHSFVPHSLVCESRRIASVVSSQTCAPRAPRRTRAARSNMRRGDARRPGWHLITTSCRHGGVHIAHVRPSPPPKGPSQHQTFNAV